MTDEFPPRGALVEVTWVHVFEQDTSEGWVFVREDSASIPLSRRPRLRFVLHGDGTAEIASPGADDRQFSREAHWIAEGAGAVVSSNDGRHVLHVVENEGERLIVKADR
jgi:hypothetical protein